MVNVTPEMFADGQAVAEKALNGDSMPAAALSPKPLAAGSATSLYAALDPELECKFSGNFSIAHQYQWPRSNAGPQSYFTLILFFFSFVILGC